MPVAADVRVTFLGGLGDIGRNCAVIETDGRLVLLDCGQLFADETMPGVDSVLPDFAYLEDKLDRIEGCITTHGHEDHIGALAHLLDRTSFPVYGTAFTLGLIRNRLDEAQLLDEATLVEIGDGDRRAIGPFDCEFLPVTHSVPSGLISAITTPQGVILHSSDFKLDLQPVDGRTTDLSRIGALAHDPGVRLLLADSTNADLPGRSASESEIGPALAAVFDANEGRRIITACFSSHVHRVNQIVGVALERGRRIATLGLSMKRNLAMARQLGMLRIPDSSFLDIEDLHDADPGSVCVVSTGSQAEERSALALAAHGDSRWVELGPDDTVVLSSTPIPGNEARVARMIDAMVKRGARVEHSGLLQLHTSGHGKQDELRTLHAVARPEWFTPVHGEYRHLVAHAELAISMGMDADRVNVAVDGDQLVIDDEGVRVEAQATTGRYVYRHGSILEVGDEMLSQRRLLGREGFVAVFVTVDLDHGELVGTPWLETRGWLAPAALDSLADDLVEEVVKAVVQALDEGVDDRFELERVTRRAAGQFVNARTARRPVIVPVVATV